MITENGCDAEFVKIHQGLQPRVRVYRYQRGSCARSKMTDDDILALSCSVTHSTSFDRRSISRKTLIKIRVNVNDESQ